MADLNSLQGQSQKLRIQQDKLNQNISENRAELEKLQSEMKDAESLPPKEREQIFKKLSARHEKLKLVKENLNENNSSISKAFHALNIQVLQKIDPTKEVEGLSDSFPILMFPLRLETRFKNTNGTAQLWLRVYPDDCNVVKKEPLLTEEELVNARNFWVEIAKAGSNETAQRGAWKTLVKSHGANRSAWIIEKYKPVEELTEKEKDARKILVILNETGSKTELNNEIAKYWKTAFLNKGNSKTIEKALNILSDNLGIGKDEIEKIVAVSEPVNFHDEPLEDLEEKQIGVVMLNLPNPNSLATTKTSWNEAPKAVSMPDKFVVVTRNGDTERTHLFEKPVKEYLPVGMNPSLEENEQVKKTGQNKDIELNEDLQWMVDFDKAVECGMATRINLDNSEQSNGFDSIYVVGLRLSADEKAGKHELEDLISKHKESKQGFSFLMQGTPTNNTEDGGTEYSWIENSDESFDRIFLGSDNFSHTDSYQNHSAGQRFADSLGLDYDVLSTVQNANSPDYAEAVAMNTALFPATMGYFMEEMMDPLFNESDILETKKFFAEYVSGRGPIPSVKIGKQPYGILPIAPFSKLSYLNRDFVATHALATTPSYLGRLHGLLQLMDDTWDSLVPNVAHVGKSGDAHQLLLDILGLHANSVEFHQRYAQSIQQVYNQLTLKTGSTIIATLLATLIAERGKTILNELGIDSTDIKIPILEKYFLSEPNLLSGPLIDDVPSTETDPIRAYTADNKNYLEWLRTANGETIRKQDFGGNPSPRALLYMLLRHSVQLAQSNSATGLLLSNQQIKQKKEFHDPDFLHVQEFDSGKSKFEHLYNPNQAITGNASEALISHIYKPDILSGMLEVRPLKETLEAIEQLENVPTARLERLLVEHLDCCSYRLDSWKTGLVQHKLMEYRNSDTQEQTDKGLYLGAYGWLLDVRPKKEALQKVTLSQEDASIFTPSGEDIFEDPSNLGYIHAPSVDQASAAAILRNAYDSNSGEGKNPFSVNLTSERVRLALSFLEGIRNGQSLSALLGYQFERGLHDKYDTSGIEADKFIYPLRMAFPLVSERLKSTKTTDQDKDEALEANNSDTNEIEAIEARNVIDGLKLIQHFQDSDTKEYPFGLPSKYKLPSATSNEAEAIKTEVERLVDINDAIADLVMSEQVYQAVKGNFERAAGVADAFGKGTYPPEMEIVNTPRTGLALTHKLAIHFNPEASNTVSPNSVPFHTTRSKTEPGINEWLTSILPNPEKVQCKVRYQEPGEPEQELLVSQKDLKLQPIDLLYSANFEADQAMTELDDRIEQFVLFGQTTPLSPFTKVSIHYTEEIHATDKSFVSFFELSALIQSLRKVLIEGKYITHSSLRTPVDEKIEGLPVYNHSAMQTSIEEVLNEISADKTALAGMVSALKSLEGTEQSLKETLAINGVEEGAGNRIAEKFPVHAKEYFFNQNPDKRSELISEYETSIGEHISDSTIIATLTSDYGAFLDDYCADYTNIPNVITAVCSLFSKISFYDNTQTSTGFIFQELDALRTGILEKIATVESRWIQKQVKYNTAMAAYNPALTDEELFAILQKAERAISTTSTLPLPATPAVYKTLVESKAASFGGSLADIQTIPNLSNTNVLNYLSQVESIVSSIGDFDLINFDAENSRNDLYSSVLRLLNLKEEIFKTLNNVLTVLENKIEMYTEAVAELETLTSDEAIVAARFELIKILLGNDALLLPKFSPSAEKAYELEELYNKHEDLLNFVKTNENRDFPVDDWFSGVARVRSGAREFENISFLSEAFNPNSMVELLPFQFPYKENDRWLAMKFVMDKTEPGYNEETEKPFEKRIGDSLLYTAHFAGSYNSSQEVCGLVFDEWTEVVPAREETTGIAFHYDQPSSEPPQTMLLMVSPVKNRKWEWQDIVDSLDETLQMAKKRAVEPSMVGGTKFGQFLPSTMMAVASHWITIAMNLAVNNEEVEAN